jgi:tRNA U55 pseudouridine synthase TruB
VKKKIKRKSRKFLGKDKEYVATFLVGVKTDTGDCLGLILNGTGLVGEATEHKIKNQVEKLKSITSQTYPWFSGKTVDGMKLFDHFKSGNTDIDRPEQDIQIKEVEVRDFWPQKTEDVKNYIFDSIAKVHGDFRQEEIVAGWRKFFAEYENDKILTFEIRTVVSSGTFIRALTENFDFPTTLLKLKRMSIKDNGL